MAKTWTRGQATLKFISKVMETYIWIEFPVANLQIKCFKLLMIIFPFTKESGYLGGNFPSKKNYSLGGGNRLVSHGSCWFGNGKGFHEGKKGKEIAYIRLCAVSTYMLTCAMSMASEGEHRPAKKVRDMLKGCMQNAHRHLSSLWSKINLTAEAKLTMTINFIPVFNSAFALNLFLSNSVFFNCPETWLGLIAYLFLNGK